MANKKGVYKDKEGNVTGSFFMYDLKGAKGKVPYNQNEWFASSQEGVRKMTTEIGKSLYTVKGLVFHYLTSVLEYGNFAPFVGTHIAKELKISRTAVYKAKGQLIEDGLIKDAIDTASGIKGVVIPDILVHKGEVNSNIVIINHKEEKEEKQKKKA